MKRTERLNSNKKRDKYWQLVRDLHGPKISDVKKIEMDKLKEKNTNKRLLIERKQSLHNKLLQNKSVDFNPSHKKLENIQENKSLLGHIKKKRAIKKKKVLEAFTAQNSQSSLQNKSFDYLKHRRNIRDQNKPEDHDEDNMVSFSQTILFRSCVKLKK